MNSDICCYCRKRRDQHRSTDQGCPIGNKRHGTHWQFSNVSKFAITPEDLPRPANVIPAKVTESEAIEQSRNSFTELTPQAKALVEMARHVCPHCGGAI